MFNNCTSLTKIPEGINFKSNISGTTISNMFQNCKSLTTIENNNIFCCSAIINYDYVFNNCINLTNIDSSVQLPQTITSTIGLFQNCSSLNCDITNFFPTSIPTGKIDISNMFQNCVNIYGKLPDYLFNVNNNIIGDHAFAGCTGLTDYDKLPSDWTN